MGSSKYVTIQQAARYLGCSDRSIYRKTRRGQLEFRTEGRHVLILEDSLLTLKKGQHDLLTSRVTKETILKMQVELQTLKTQVATCMRILNVRYDPLNSTLPEYENMYKSAEQLSIEGWPPHVEEPWAEYFLRLRTEDFEKIEIVTHDVHPWRPFLRLANSMYAAPWSKELSDLLAAGKKNIENLAGIWCVLKEESPRAFDMLVERDGAPLKKLVRRMTKAQRPPEQPT